MVFGYVALDPTQLVPAPLIIEPDGAEEPGNVEDDQPGLFEAPLLMSICPVGPDDVAVTADVPAPISTPCVERTECVFVPRDSFAQGHISQECKISQ